MTELKPVSFRKARGHEPRLSPKRVKGKHAAWYWTDAEIAILRRYYPLGGAAACEAHLPNRKGAQIYLKVQELGIKRAGRYRNKKRARIEVPDDIDDRIRAAWRELDGKKKGEVSALAKQLGVPRYWLTTRATKLGLTIPHTKEPRWTDAETALMNKVPLHDPHRCAEIFREHGFRRSPTAIMVRAKKLKLSRRYRDTLSAGAAARILGVDSKFVTRECIAGEIKATRRGTKRLPQQGGDHWSIEPADLRRHILDNIERIDQRKVDWLAFVQLVSGEALRT